MSLYKLMNIAAKIILIFFYHKKLDLLEITQKTNQKPRPKLEKYVYYIFTENTCSTCNSMQVVVFRKNILTS